MKKIITNEASRRICLDCKYAGGDLGNDSCQQCGNRYTPNENENCPECDSPHYDSHCPDCNSTEIFYYEEAIEILKEQEVSV